MGSGCLHMNIIMGSSENYKFETLSKKSIWNIWNHFRNISVKCHNGSYLENSLAYTCACDNEDDISTVLSTA